MEMDLYFAGIDFFFYFSIYLMILFASKFDPWLWQVYSFQWDIAANHTH